MSSYNEKEIYCKRLPKVELHAHLNGSLSSSTIEELKSLCGQKSQTTSNSTALQPIETSISSCFDVFSQIHDLVRSQEALVIATKRVIEEFSADQVKYLELRSTPKEIDNGDTSVSKVEYIESILHAIQEAKIGGFPSNDIIVKLLISVDRARGTKDAFENVQLASRFSKQSDAVIGLDFSGDPYVDGRDIIPALQFAKREGLKISAHLAEVPDKNEETFAILESVIPDRIGHGTFIHSSKGGSKAIEDFVISKKIPLEICLTSNVNTGTVKDYYEHPYKIWHELNHPFILCTDDKGLFNSTLSNEYYLSQKYSSIGKDDLYNLSRQSLEYIFDDSCKEKLKKYWDKFNKDI